MQILYAFKGWLLLGYVTIVLVVEKKKEINMSEKEERVELFIPSSD